MGIKTQCQNVTGHGHICAAHVRDCVEVFERSELDLHIVVTLAQLFEQKLAQVFSGGPRLTTGRYTFDRDKDAFVIRDRAFHAGQLRVGRDAA
jgi:hypothetical protein